MTEDKITNQDLNSKIDKILIKQINIESDLKNVKEEMATKQGIHKVLNVADEIKKKYDDHETEHVADIDAHDRMQGEINETRQHVGLPIKTRVVI